MLLNTKNLLFFYKITRGGIFCFSNNIRGFISLKIISHIIADFIFFKEYFILIQNIGISFFYSNFPTFNYYTAGFLRNFNRIKKSLRRFFFKRFNIIFNFKTYFYKKYLKYFLKIYYYKNENKKNSNLISTIRYLKVYGINIFFKLLKLLVKY